MSTRQKRMVVIVSLVLVSNLFAGQKRTATRSSSDLTKRARAALAQTSGHIELDGLAKPVQVLRDPWGIPHIYAETVEDLFFAQGFVAAQDRLWQMEIWRRTGEGRLAEIVGPSAIERDKFARLLRYRGDMEAEWKSYAPDARHIIESFVRGVNAFITSRHDRLPIEFQLVGIRPEPWTPEVCLTRMAGYIMVGNASSEVLRAQLAHRLGVERTAELLETDPPRKLEIPLGLDLSGIDRRILAAANAARAPITFDSHEGSNNWVVGGALTATGRPILANDPHRTITLPSLRYMVHLVGPGWNVIGAGEPALPGVALGHNEHIGFGFTIFAIDQQDIYVEETDPQDATRYRYKGEWERMKIEKEHIRVRGKAQPVAVELHLTRHGPVIYEDRERHRAYALRWVGSEPGAAGYLAALALDRATDWTEFLSALARWKLPPENIVYADVAGNIGWQAAGFAPVRRGWPGLLPVPGSAGQWVSSNNVRQPALTTLVKLLKHPDSKSFGANPQTKRDQILIDSLTEAWADLGTRLGVDVKKWRWGDLHLAEFKHPLSTDAATRSVLDLKPVPRGGDGYTVNATGGSDFLQTTGASYRQILDLSDWDNSVAINVPGQSGQPGSPHYADLLPLWTAGKYFPLLFNRAMVEKNAKQRLILEPRHK